MHLVHTIHIGDAAAGKGAVLYMAYYAVPLGRCLSHIGRNIEHGAHFILYHGAVEQRLVEYELVGIAAIQAYTPHSKLAHLADLVVDVHGA